MSRPLNTTLQDRIKVLEQQLREAQNTVLRLQASRTPIKWPTRIQAQEEAEECFDCDDSIEGFLSGYDWLKSFIIAELDKKDKSE